MKISITARVNRTPSKTSFFLLKPLSKKIDSEKMARTIAASRFVKEVHMTEGEYGFLVSTKCINERDIRHLSSLTKRITDGDIKILRNCFIYK